VPQGIQVTGYNDFDFRNYTSPLLTTITSPAEAIGLRGAQAILSRLDAGAFPTRTIELPVRLNLGDTTLPAGEAPRRA
jgi:LacI family transcriptional regulator